MSDTNEELDTKRRATWDEQQALYDKSPLSHLNPAAEDWRRTAQPPYGYAAPARTEHKAVCVGIDEERLCECAPSRVPCPDVATCCVSGCTLKARTEAEQAVLDAMGAIHHGVLRVVRRHFQVRFPAVGAMVSAEFARRGLKP